MQGHRYIIRFYNDPAGPETEDMQVIPFNYATGYVQKTLVKKLDVQNSLYDSYEVTYDLLEGEILPGVDQIIYDAVVQVNTTLPSEGVPVPPEPDPGSGSEPTLPPFPADPEPWVRPADWLPMPAITPGDQVFNGLFAVFDANPNYVALTAEGDYTVDWGDGTVEDVDGGVTAEHDYDYSTYDVAEDTLCTRGYKQAMITVTPQVGSDLTLVYDQTHSGDTVHLPAWLDQEANGTLLSMLIVGGYNVSGAPMLESVCIKENVLTAFGYGYFPSMQQLIADTLSLCESVILASSFSLRSLMLPDLPVCTFINIRDCFALQKVVIGDAPLCSSTNNTFANCFALQQVQLGNIGTDVGAAVDFSNMFTGCAALTHVTIGDVDLANTTLSTWFTGAASPLYISMGDVIGDGTLNFSSMGIVNPSLIKYIKIGNLPDVTSLANMCFDLRGLRIFEMGDAPLCESVFHAWQECYMLEKWIVGDLTAVTNAEGMLQNTFALRSVALNMPVCMDFNNMLNYGGVQELTMGNIRGDAVWTQALTQASNLRKLTVGNILGTTFPIALFASAPALQEIVIGDGLDVTSMASAFSDSTAKSISIGNFPAATTFDLFADSAKSLVTATVGGAAGATVIVSFLSYGGSLTSVGLFDTSGATNMNEAFAGQPLCSIPAFDLSGATNLGDLVSGCTALSWCDAFGARVSISFVNCNFGVDGLVNLFEKLGTARVGELIYGAVAGQETGSGYAAGELLTVDGGNGDATFLNSPGGSFATIGDTCTIVNVGTGYTSGVYPVLGGSGTGGTVSVDASEVETITVTGNPGTPYLTAAQKAIAEAKGWTVVTIPS